MRTGTRTSLVLSLALACAGAAAAQPDPAVFATVDGAVITVQEYAQALREGVRNRFYHGRVPEAELARFQREVGEQLVERALLDAEAIRRGIEPDADWVEAKVEEIDRRASRHRDWAENRERMLPLVRAQMQTRSRVERLEAAVREVAPPSDGVLRDYYRANPDRFTEPERVRMSVILLKVDPSAGTPAWEAARAEAEQIVARLRAGADFAELARLHSGDGSAENGGDMGYVHRGMLGDVAQTAVDEAALGAVTDPITLLEGVAIFRVDERPERRLRGFEEVEPRARELWLREQRDQAWEVLVERLRSEADIQVDTQHYLPLPENETARM